MVDLAFVKETVQTMLLTLYYILVGIIKAILPAKLLPKKSVTKEKVLITGAGMYLSLSFINEYHSVARVGVKGV